MRYRSEKTKQSKTHFSSLIMRIAATLGCLTIISAYLLSGMYARYTTSSSGNDSARVAKWDVAVKNFAVSSIRLSENAPDGTYTFTVDNQSEVSVRCIVRVKFPSAPIAGITLTLGTQTLNTDGTKTEFIFTDAPIKLGYAQSQSVILTVAAENFNNAIDIDGITVWVDAEQVD